MIILETITEINTMEQYIIGLDIGTGSTKAVALATNGKVIASSQFYYSTNSPENGYSEQDPEVIWQAFVHCINEIVTKIRPGAIAISFSAAMHSILAMDNTNTAITPLITWADTRSEKIAESIRNSSDGERIYTLTGMPIHSMSPLCKIKWIKENAPETFNNTSKFISIKEFIWHRLFNAYQVDYSIAAATGLFNIMTFEWNEASLQLCGIAESHLSEIVPTDFIRKSIDPITASTLNVPADTIFCIGSSDGCLANIGSYSMQHGVAALTIGTSGAVRITGNKPVVNYGAMIFNYPIDKKTFISGGAINNGGSVLKWVFQTLLNKKDPVNADYDDLFKIIETIPAGSRGLLFLPYLYGERSPVWDERASGIFFGIKSYHTNAHFLRAALEGICFTLKNILEVIEVSAVAVSHLNVSGGFVHSKIWTQMLADICGKKLFLQQTEDASSVGAALLYMKAINIFNDYSHLHADINVTIVPCGTDHALYEKYYRVFKSLYKPLRDSMHELAAIDSGFSF
ncbi:MAG: gluconokinase [Ginsengibacter sp.]